MHDAFIRLVAKSLKDERFAFAYEDVLGFKLATAAQAKDRSAGFVR